MVCLIINGEKLPGEEALVKSLRQIPETVSVMVNVNKKRNNVILGEKVRLLWGQPYITDKIGEISYQISPLSFFPGKSLPDRASLWKSTGICTAFRK